MKRELAQRPSLLLAGGLVCGLVASEFWVPAAFIFVLLWMAQGLGWRLALATAFLLGLILAPQPVPRVDGERLYQGEAIVLAVPELSERSQIATVEVAGSRFWMVAPVEPTVGPGDVVEVKGRMSSLSPGRRERLSSQTLAGEIYCSTSGLRIVQNGNTIYRGGLRWRSSFVDFTQRTLEPSLATMVNALCFNVRSDLDDKTYANLQATGTVHIISASGLHVFIFAAGLTFLLSFVPIPRGWRLLAVGGVLTVYAIGAGMQPPVVRAVAMAAILGGATLVRREPDLLAALGLTAFLFLLWQPIAVYDIGFQISFVTLGALAMFAHPSEGSALKALPRLYEGVKEVAKASLVATLGSAPIVAFYFGWFSLVSIPANVLIALVLPFITLTAFAAQLIEPLAPVLSLGLMAGMVTPLAGWVQWVVEQFGSLGFAGVSVPSFSGYWMVPYYAAGLLLWRPYARPR